MTIFFKIDIQALQYIHIQSICTYIRVKRSFADKAAVVLRGTAGNFYVNDKSTGSVVGQQPFGGARLSGTNDKAGGPHYMLKWSSAQAVKQTFVPLTDVAYPYMKV